MKIYIASSWRNQHAVEMLTKMLETRGHEVISFVRKAALDEGRANFGTFTIDDWIESPDGLAKFTYDLDGATNSDLVVYIGPSGTDAWAEVGAAWASGVRIIGLWAKGEPAGLMRLMMERWFRNYESLIATIATEQARAGA